MIQILLVHCKLYTFSVATFVITKSFDLDQAWHFVRPDPDQTVWYTDSIPESFFLNIYL